MNRADSTPAERVKWDQVGLFLAVTFALTWLLDLALWRTVGYGAHPAAGTVLQLQMLLPAFSAITLGTFVFRDSPLHHGVIKGRSRFFFYYFMLYTLAYILLSAWGLASQQAATGAAAIGQGLTLLGLLLMIALRPAAGREEFARVGLALGHIKWWVLFGLGIVLLYSLQTLFNYLFGLGQPVDIGDFLESAVPADSPQVEAFRQMPPLVFLLIAGLQSVLLAPVLAILIAFGEEYGWRGYLQGELSQTGRVRGTLLVGAIWGIWHAPIIAMGHNYPGYPVAGIFLMIAYSMALAFILGYAVLKSGSIWLAAYLHALNNQTFSFLAMLVYTPGHPVFSFGAGVYGIAVMAIVVLVILQDPVWRGRGSPIRL